MGAMRKMAVYLGLVEDDPEAYADDPEAERYEQAAARSRAPEPTRSSASVRTYDEEPRYTAVREVRPSARAERPPTRVDRVEVREQEMFDAEADSYRITTLHPRSYNDARRIGEEFRMGTPVIMNLTEMDDTDAKRLVDFSAGLIFGLHGSIERVTNKVFLLSPANVDVAAEAKRLAQDGFFNQS